MSDVTIRVNGVGRQLDVDPFRQAAYAELRGAEPLARNGYKVTGRATDPHLNPLGAKGIGEIGIAGTAAAIGNAVYHATGRRIRDLPITPARLLTDR